MHTYADTFTYDAHNHWLASTCEHTDLKKDEAPHTTSDWITEKGSKYKKCTVWGRIMQVAEITSGSYNYKITDSQQKTVALTGFAKGKSTSNVTLKNTVTYKGTTYQITSIADKAFFNNTKIKKINLGNNITMIGRKAFYGCSKLTEAVIGNKVTELSDHAFYKCTSLKKMTVGTSLKKIGKHVFCHAKKLRVLTIKSRKLTSIGKHNLYQCNNLTIKVPSSKLKSYKNLFKKQGQKSSVKITK